MKLTSVSLLVFSVFLMGCSDAREGMGTVTGTITLDGSPLPDAAVEFTSEQGGRASYGRTDSDGYYELMATRTAKGAAVGAHKVRITTEDVIDDNGEERVVPETVPAKYNTQTELTENVGAGSNTINFELISGANG